MKSFIFGLTINL